MNIHLKKAGLDDISALISLEERLAGNKIYSPLLTESEWKASLGKTTTYIIEEDGEPVGNVSYEFKSAAEARIDGLAILPDFQGKGIGKKVMQLILEELKDVPVIDLVTHPENVKAIGLYESLGFKKGEVMENYFGDGEPRMRMILERNLKTD